MRNYVTRLVKGTEAIVKVINKTTDEITEQSAIISKIFKEDELPKVRKEVDKLYKDSDFVVITVKEYHTISKLYGIPVSLFMENAVELDPTTRKLLDVDMEDSETEEVTD